MERRNFLNLSAIAGGAMLLGSVSQIYGATENESHKSVKQPVTLYFEFHIMPPQKDKVINDIEHYANSLKSKSAFLSLSLKQMTGDSTMVKNYPAKYKGVLSTSYKDGVEMGTLPYFYALLIRFDTLESLKHSGCQEWFKSTIAPSMPVFHPKENIVISTDYYQGIYETLACGDRHGVYTTHNDIIKFLKNQQDFPAHDYVTVENHVMIKKENQNKIAPLAVGLLTVAQETFMPLDISGGRSGTLDVTNTDYKTAVTTEIMQNISPNGDLLSYILHGTWESVADHENSHLDPRFKKALAPVGAMVVVGPVEPFYNTTVLVNN